MTCAEIKKALESLGHERRLERISELYGLPHAPEFELSYFKELYRPELTALRDAAEAWGDDAPAEALAWRGRLRRLFGDLPGAAESLKEALDKDPRAALAQAWLGELDLTAPAALECLDRALALDARLSCARLYRGAALLSRGRDGEAARDLSAALALGADEGLTNLLLGVAFERRGLRAKAAKAYAAAAAAHPACSAAYLALSRCSDDPKKEALFFRKAYDVSPVLGFITLQIHRTLKIESPAYVRRIRAFAFRDPEKVGAYYRREATQSHFSHFPAEDYEFVEKLAAENPDIPWVQAFFGRAACYTPDGMPEGVRRLSRAIELSPGCGWFYAWRANALRVLGRYDEALADFASSMRLQPFYHRAYVWRGSLLRKLGRYREALADLDRAVAMDPYYSLTYFERFSALRGLGDPASAAADLDRAFALDHRYSWAFRTGGEPTPRDRDRGLEELDAAILREPGVTSLRVWRGQLQLERRRFSDALKDLEAATRLDPWHALAFGWHGCALLQTGQAEAARERLRRALKLDAGFWICYRWLAEAERALGRPAASRAVLRGVLARKPKTPWVYLELARLDLAAAKPREAIAKLERALLLDGKYPEAYLELAQARLALGQTALALAAVEKAAGIAPNLGRVFLVRASVHERAGRAPEMVADYRRVLEEFPYLFNPEQRRAAEAVLAAA